MLSSIPEKLFILEMANNHMGNAEHGRQIIRECAEVCKEFPFNFAFKLQYRHLDTFIHPDFKERNDIKYVKRFLDTRLNHDARRSLVQEIKKHDFIPICTPFDEVSVDHIIEDKFDILKVGSCSFTDWPLLERIATTDKPIICSTAGATLDEIDNVIAFFEHRSKEFVMMHCVAEYPTSSDHMELNQIDLLKSRYPHIRFGYSTHEHPDETLAVAMAIAKGCTVFEKHVGVATGQYSLNDYSATPKQLRTWLQTAERAFSMAGIAGKRIEPGEKEVATLLSLRRGVFAKRDIELGTVLRNEDIFLAIPAREGQVTANELSKYNRLYTTSPMTAGSAILHSHTRKECLRDQVLAIVLQVHDLLKRGNITIPTETKLEISHHYGIDKFYEFGAALITVINREYCKKVLVVLPGQKHPNHYHKKKDETLHVLYGTLTVTLNGVTKDYSAGEMVVVEPGMHHSFESKLGTVFEEISSTHFVDDSIYTDPNIIADRKTFTAYWTDVTSSDVEKGLKLLEYSRSPIKV